MGKFLKKNRGLVVSTGSVIVVLLAGLIVSLWMYHRSKNALEAVSKERDEKTKALRRVEMDAFEVGSPKERQAYKQAWDAPYPHRASGTRRSYAKGSL